MPFEEMYIIFLIFSNKYLVPNQSAAKESVYKESVIFCSEKINKLSISHCATSILLD